MYGRKTVLAISALGPMIAPLLWMIDAWLQPGTDWLVYIAGIALSLTAVGGPAQTAMLADLVTPAERGFCFPVLHAVQKAAPLAAQVIGVAALSLHLQDYTAFWAIMFATQVVIIFVLCTYLPETLPAHKQRAKEWRHLNPLRHYLEAAKLVARDWLLLAMCLWVFLTYIALGGFGAIFFSFLVGDLHYLQVRIL